MFFFFKSVCFIAYFVFSIAVLPHSSVVMYYNIMLRLNRILGIFLCTGTNILYTHGIKCRCYVDDSVVGVLVDTTVAV